MPSPFIMLTLIAWGQLVNDGYVDDARCARCHAEIAETFSHHGMGRSLWVPGPTNAIEDFSPEGGTYRHQASGLNYRMRLDDDGRMWMTQFELDNDDSPFNVVDVEAHFAVGSGNHARTYLHRSPSGELWELPVSWYTGVGWRMSPGYDHADQQRFARQVSHDCIFCHTGYPDIPVGEDRPGRLLTFPTQLPMSIGCQRCHGPGEAHVRLAYSPNATAEEIAAAIDNPADFSTSLADDLCLQCHMQPSSRLGSLVRPFDRGFYSYRPGEAIETYLAHIDFPRDNGERAELEINHHGYQLNRSRCVLDGGRIGCLECHDPHRKLTPDAMAQRTRATCFRCHEPAECRVETVLHIPRSEAQTCANCHMPHHGPVDVIHAGVTNHRIQNPAPLPPVPTQDGPPPTDTTPQLLFPDRFKDDPAAATYPLLGEMYALTPRQVGELDRLLVGETRISPRLLLAQGLDRNGQPDRSREILESIILEAPWATTAQINLSTLDINRGDLDEAQARLETIVQETPNAAAAWANLSTIHARQGRLDEAIAAARQAAALRPIDASAHARVAIHLASSGNFVEAAATFATAESLSPGDPSVGYNLGLALFKSGDSPAAATAWRQALRRSPQATRLLRSNIIMRTLPFEGVTPDPQAARHWAATLYKANPASGDATLMVALALLANDELESLPQVLSTAEALRADPAAVRLIEVCLLAVQGQLGEATAIRDRVRSNLKQIDMLREGLLRRAGQSVDPTN